MKRARLRHWIEYLVFRSLVCVLQALSMPQCVWLSERLATFVLRVLPARWTRLEIARENLRRAFGDRLSDEQIDQTIHRMWVHLFRIVAEMVHAPRKLRLNRIHDCIAFRDRHRVVQALCSGRPVILVSGHFGNWEVAVSVFGLFGFPMGVVGRELDNPLLESWLRRFRQHTGHRAIAKKGGADAITATLEKGGCVAMLADQDAGSRGLFVDFFGRPASTFKSIALLALHYRALICVGYARRLPDDFQQRRWSYFELGCEEIIDPLEIDTDNDVREITQRYTAALERAIRRSPEQYFWVHRRWKSEPRRKQRRRGIQSEALRKAG